MKSRGMYMKTEKGNIAHVLADPNMSKETQNAINKVIDLVYANDDEKLPCHACQGGGCPVCNGFGYYCN